MGLPIRNGKEFSVAVISESLQPKGEAVRWNHERPTTAVLFAALVAGVHTYSGGQLGQLFQGMSFLMVSGTVFLMSLRNLGWMTTMIALSASSLLGRPVDPRDPSIRDFNDHVAGWAMMGGHVGGVLGLIHVMTTLQDVSNIGAGVAVAFTSYLYGGVAALVLPFSVRTKGASGLRAVDALLPLGVLSMITAAVLFAISK